MEYGFNVSMNSTLTIRVVIYTLYKIYYLQPTNKYTI